MKKKVFYLFIIFILSFILSNFFKTDICVKVDYITLKDVDSFYEETNNGNSYILEAITGLDEITSLKYENKMYTVECIHGEPQKYMFLHKLNEGERAIYVFNQMKNYSYEQFLQLPNPERYYYFNSEMFVCSLATLRE